MSVVAKQPIHPLLASYLRQLALRPLSTKCITAAVLLFVQDILSSHLAGVPSFYSKVDSAYTRALKVAKIDSRAFKMAAYGFFVSAPMSHLLVGSMQKFFAGKTSPLAKVAQLLGNNLLIAPIQSAVYLVCVAIINGARTRAQIEGVVRSKFMGLLKITWATSPLAIVVAQRFLSPELWVPFFNLVSFSVGTFVNTVVKKNKVREAARQEKEKGRE